jgi:hypothetical protein
MVDIEPCPSPPASPPRGPPPPADNKPKLTLAQAADCLERLRHGSTRTALANEYGVDRSTMSSRIAKAADEEARAAQPPASQFRQRAWRLATLPPCQARLGAESAPCHPCCRQPCHPASTLGRRTL